ncbi:hypothetical protein BH792_gp146 [Staphylococcus phage Stau2]|uniref:BofL n=1 Tax=Staphylococcus phage Stau2 TaxID=1200862 RepID=A0A0U1ZW30_9CAUD|nr:hypothetical protein BH792_gp146 [Staphylococcus phage Stau2]AKA61396.1 hypothetical protein Stau2_145 [Staphylococcus phage Stau2]
MKYYQVEHDNCELYEDSYSYREDKIYTSKEQLIKDIKSKGYKELQGMSRNHDGIAYLKHIDDFRDDMITIHEIEIVDNK